jgi:hypothetical protein
VTVNSLREDITQLRISIGKIETRLDIYEKNMDKLCEKVDGFTWKLVLGLVCVVAAQYFLRFIQ